MSTLEIKDIWENTHMSNGGGGGGEFHLTCLTSLECPQTDRQTNTLGTDKITSSANAGRNEWPNTNFLPHVNKVKTLYYQVTAQLYYEFVHLLLLAIKGTFKSAEGIKGGPVTVKIYADEILKSTNVLIPTNTDLTLWAESGCICPYLAAKQQWVYLTTRQLD